MNLHDLNTDYLSDLRAEARVIKDFALSDAIRAVLDSRGSFVMDTPYGQVIYHMGTGYTRDYMTRNIQDINANFKRNERSNRKSY